MKNGEEKMIRKAKNRISAEIQEKFSPSLKKSACEINQIRKS